MVSENAASIVDSYPHLHLNSSLSLTYMKLFRLLSCELRPETPVGMLGEFIAIDIEAL